jgi:hypothetical protein
LFLLSLFAFDAPALAAGGAEVYAAHCAVCHLAQGEGTPGFVPPLTGTLGHYLADGAGRSLLARIVAGGMAGSIEVGGKRYSGAMRVLPPVSDEEGALALNHVLQRFNAESIPADFVPFEAAEIARARDAKTAPTELHAERQALVTRLKQAGKAR